MYNGAKCLSLLLPRPPSLVMLDEEDVNEGIVVEHDVEHDVSVAP